MSIGVDLLTLLQWIGPKLLVVALLALVFLLVERRKKSKGA